MKVSPWAWLAWAVVTGVSFLVLEGIGIWDGVANDTATQTGLHHLPAALLIALTLGLPAWLIVHFGTRIWRNRRGKQDGL